MVLMEHAFFDNEKVEKQPKAYQRKKEDHEFDLLIDIQKKLAQGKGKYYVRFAKNFNTKQVAKAVLYLKQHDIRSYDDLEKNVKTATERFTELSAFIKEKEKRLAEIQVSKKHIFDYFKTKDVYADYRKCGYSYTEKIVIPNSLPEPNLLRTSFQEFGITFLSLAVFPIQKCFEYH